MTDQQFILEVLKIVAPLVGAFIAFLTLQRTNQTAKQLDNVHQQINGQLHEQKSLIAQVARSAGVAEGIAAMQVSKPEDRK